MQERIRRTPTSEFARSDEYRAAQREGKLRHPREPARGVAYLVLPATQRNGDVVEYADDAFRKDVEAALPE
jgi:hypothetical protein